VSTVAGISQTGEKSRTTCFWMAADTWSSVRMGISRVSEMIAT
jgi:hypothetical protein